MTSNHKVWTNVSYWYDFVFLNYSLVKFYCL